MYLSITSVEIAISKFVEHRHMECHEHRSHVYEVGMVWILYRVFTIQHRLLLSSGFVAAIISKFAGEILVYRLPAKTFEGLACRSQFLYFIGRSDSSTIAR